MNTIKNISCNEVEAALQFCRLAMRVVLDHRRLIRFIAILSVCAAFVPVATQAQTTSNFDPPDIKLVDKVGVNLISGLVQIRSSPVSIGPKESALTLDLEMNGDAIWVSGADGFAGEIYKSHTYGLAVDDMVVHLFNQSSVFRGGSATDLRKTGATLNQKSDGSYEYISRDGVRYIVSPSIAGWHNESGGVNMAITKVVYPNGLEISINRSSGSGTPIQSVTTNYGYQLRYAYNANGALQKVTAVNLAVDYCDSAASSCSYSRIWPTATFSVEGNLDANNSGKKILTITDSVGRATKYTTQYGYGQYFTRVYYYIRLTSVQWPSSPSAANVTFGYGEAIHCVADEGSWNCDDLRGSLVASVDMAGGHWSYSYKQDGVGAPSYAGQDGLWTTTATSQEGFVTQAHYDVKKGTVGYVYTSDGQASYSDDLPNYDGFWPNRLMAASDEEGRNFSFTYDGRGNVLTKTQSEAGGSRSLVWEANYDNVCANPVTCNKPNWIKDPNKNQTDFTYDSVHGGVLTETSPADVNGIRPQKRYKYIQRIAMIKNSSGGFSPAGPPIWVLDTMSYCRSSNATATGCSVAGDEVVTKYDYGSTNGGNNLTLRGMVITADGASRRVCYAYDALGNKISETTPNAGLASCY